jgi:sRNA-binding regulator protein Hfq
VDQLANQKPLIINKLEAARRQLITAIRMYFANGDEISTHTLTAAAFEILDDLDNHGANTGTVFDHAEEYVEPEYVSEFRKLRSRAQNLGVGEQRSRKPV